MATLEPTAPIPKGRQERYSFVIVLARADAVNDDLADKLYRRCPDATLSTRGDEACIVFDREATSLEQAITTALDDVRAVGLKVVRVASEGQETIDKINASLEAL